MSSLFIDRGATFSECRNFRWLWWEIWGDGPKLVGLCLNPSKADERKKDPTVTRMVERAHRLGFSGFKMLNLFGLVSTDSSVLKNSLDPIGLQNDLYIARECKAAGMVIAGWGNASPLIPARALDVRKMLAAAGVKLHYLKMGSTGQPWHPLYVGYEVQPKEWIQQ